MDLAQIAILSITAIALFYYARDTKIMTHQTHRQAEMAAEAMYEPLAQLTVTQPPMTADRILCPMELKLRRPVPFLAKIDVNLEVDGKRVPTGVSAYDGELEWCIFNDFRNLPCRLTEALEEALPPGKDLLQFLTDENSETEMERRVAVTPVMVYKHPPNGRVKLTSAARSYLKPTEMEDGSTTFMWIPDVDRSRYPDMTWKKDEFSDFELDRVTE